MTVQPEATFSQDETETHIDQTLPMDVPVEQLE